MIDLPAQMARAARRIDRSRAAIAVTIAAVWIALGRLAFSGGSTLSHARAIAIALVLPLALAGIWLVVLWAWFRHTALPSSGEMRGVWPWFRSVFLLLFAVLVVFMGTGAAHLFLDSDISFQAPNRPLQQTNAPAIIK